MSCTTIFSADEFLRWILWVDPPESLRSTSRHPHLLTIGIDLAAEPAGTAMAEVQWDDGAAKVARLSIGVTNEIAVAAADRADKIGIDCALGWPDEFVEFVTRHAAFQPPAESELSGMDWRRRLAYRETDRFVHAQVGKWPLSVSADRLGLTAMRCASLLEDLTAAAIEIDRSGQTGKVVEVYPAAGLRVWGIGSATSKRTESGLGQLVDALQEGAPWLDFAAFDGVMRSSHDAFDAVIASLLARSQAMGLVHPPPSEVQEQALREGWIAIPSRRLSTLI